MVVVVKMQFVHYQLLTFIRECYGNPLSYLVAQW